MKLILFILGASFVGYIIFSMGTEIGIIVSFGVVAGCLFRGLYLLTAIRNKLNKLVPDTDKATDAYKSYLENKQNNR